MNKRNNSMLPYNRGGGNCQQLYLPRNNIRSHFDEFDQMADRMMSNFGMPKMDLMMPFGGRDPFSSDPFFADSGFGRMDKMMKDMRNEMKQVMNSGFSMNSIGGGPGQGHFVQQTFVSSTKLDQNGRPVQEKYQNKVAGAIGNGNKVIERQQMYDHSGINLQKASHERMLNGKGRKIVKEKIGNQMNSHELYKNLREEEAGHFDQNWGQMATQLGLPSSNYNNRMLGYGGSSGNNRASSYQPIQYDDNRRGAYVDNSMRAQNHPVTFNRQATDLAPTQPGANPIRQTNNNTVGRTGVQQPAAPLALTDGRPPAPVRQAVNRAPQQNNNYAIPRTNNNAKAPARPG